MLFFALTCRALFQFHQHNLRCNFSFMNIFKMLLKVVYTMSTDPFCSGAPRSLLQYTHSITVEELILVDMVFVHPHATHPLVRNVLWQLKPS